MEKTSPKNVRRVSSTAPELENASCSTSMPAAPIAVGDAGMTPPFTAIAARLSKPPSATSHNPETRRFAPTNTATNA